MQESFPSETTASFSDPDKDEAAEERRRQCRKDVQKYQSYWKEVPTMTSSELYQLIESNNNTQQEEDQKESIWIVDVRSEAERQVSMIQNAMTVSGLETRLQQQEPTSSASGSTDNNQNQKTRVVFYCTIGYRSGMESTHYQHAWKKTHPELECYNLDGIVSFSHVVAEKARANKSTTKRNDPGKDKTSQLASYLVDPSTGEPTWQLHTYGKAWDMGDNTAFTSSYFDGTSLPGQLAHDGYHGSKRFWQRQWHRLTKHS